MPAGQRSPADEVGAEVGVFKRCHQHRFVQRFGRVQIDEFLSTLADGVEPIVLFDRDSAAVWFLCVCLTTPSLNLERCPNVLFTRSMCPWRSAALNLHMVITAVVRSNLPIWIVHWSDPIKDWQSWMSSMPSSSDVSSSG